jgi:kinesin family member 1
MLGENSDEGLIPRVCKSIMTSPVDDEAIVTFKITYIEIFLEKVRDLLRPPSASFTPKSSTAQQSLRVREHPTDGPFVEGATSADVSTVRECMELMEIGSRNRSVASTKMNMQSSRSHAIFTLHRVQTKAVSGSAAPSEEEVYSVVSKINMVDLAGSENANTAGSTGDRLKEGAAINKSLLTLGRVIKSLADRQKADKSRRNTVEGSPRGRPNNTQEGERSNKKKEGKNRKTPQTQVDPPLFLIVILCPV